METITLVHPHTNESIQTEINAEQHEGQPVWRLTFTDGRSALIGLNQHGIWDQIDGNDLDFGLITKIGDAIELRQRRY
ncbi:hypothetical protein GZH53_02690 [Flavihumibacter sp. R14]|nr:hypothetical protein [Flavihumibacter soli]